ncbi:DUF1016 N-terminal domain-containing protein [Paenibacillus wynnii]|uniref:DUF1016 N-terminal domain-containing protein n=1 Tax=Paenibacillus wynnii TaxID=268407 RepID=UPI003593D19B
MCVVFGIGTVKSTKRKWIRSIFLRRIEKEDVRNFYHVECIQNQWRTRQLERQINSFYYERLLSSRDKSFVR